VSIDPQYANVAPDGWESQRAFLLPPAGTPSADSVLEMMVEGTGGWDQDAQSTLLFPVDFNRALVADGEARSATYLALKYPAAAVGEVWDLMRSIDLSVGR
jgi:hypothetical protein